MNNILKISLMSLAMLSVVGFVAAQEAANEDVSAEDLNISEPNLLPNSPFYFLKTLGREIQSAFTMNTVKKAELREKFASEKLIELKILAEKTQNPEAVEKATENYQAEVENVKKATEKIKQTTEENVEVGKFLDKFIQQQILHQRILEKLETQVSTTALAKIQEAREQHLEKFGEVMTRLENKEKIQERLEKNLQKVKGGEFKEFKNLEVLKLLEEKAPESAKEAIQGAQENVLKRLKNQVEAMPAEKLEQFQAYTEKMAGVKEKQVEILENLKEELKAVPRIKEILLQSREKIMEQVRERVAEENCPEIAKPGSAFCRDDRVIIKKDEKGCLISFDCLTTGTSPRIKEQIKSLIPKLAP